MSLIEGVGDEVTFAAGLFIILCLVLLAWLSTHTRDIPFVSVIVIEISQRRHRNSGNTVVESSPSVAENVENTDATEVGGVLAVDASGGQGEPDPSVAHSEDSNKKIEDSKIHVGVESKTSLESQSLTCSVSSPGLLSPSPEAGVKDGVSVCCQNVNCVRSPCPDNEETGNEDDAADDDGMTVLAKENAVQPASKIVMASSVDSISSSLSSSDSASIPSGGKSPELRRRRLAYFTKVNTDTKVTPPAEPGSPTVCDSVLNTSQTQGDEQLDNLDATLVSDSAASEHTAQPAKHKAKCDTEAASVTAATIADAAPTPSAEHDGEEGSQIRIRLKYLNETQRLVYTSPQETIGNFRRTHFSSELEENKIVRFIFNGQDLRNDLSTLGAYNIRDNSVIHCLITQNQQPSQPAGRNRSQDEDLEIGTMVFPIFGFILLLIWYLRFFYKQFFSAVSTVSLAGVSFIYILAVLSSLRGRRQARQHLE